MNTFIIDQPHRQGRVRRTAYGAVTAIAWGIYIYLWLPLLTLLAWALGARSVYTELYLQRHGVDPFLLMSLPLLALLCALVLIGWAEYNRVRFQDCERRQVPKNVSYSDVDRILGADPAFAESLRGRRVALVALDEAGRPTCGAVPQHDTRAT